LTPASASNTLSCQRETLHFIRNNSADQKSLDEDHGIYRDLRNPLGSKSAGIAGGICADLAEMAQQRQFASELRRCQRAAAARISLALWRRKGGTAWRQAVQYAWLVGFELW
jgi:hypothetical protein